MLARPGLAGVEVGQNLARRLRLLGQDQLQVMAQGGLDGRDVLVGHANLVGQRAQHMLRLLERGERARAEAFMVGLQLFQDVQPRTRSRPAARRTWSCAWAARLQFLLDLAAGASAAPRPCRAGFAR